ncbi:MAG: hypothetical protein HRU18_02835 [Pseudoalteromonas sp.]|uniref:hypothetical protein n=1 Tax=Pseudoalteromonas sp. TaxID=53249 RepID=UPI001E0545DC|nr:hypothetical protein [Pseudoalteromonas sp.]NRA77120.1 hypothetical protein [Pseudoalteromonas sp.]
MIIWLLRLASKSSDNKIDDHLVTVVEGAYDSDQKKVQEGLSKLVAVWNEEKKEVIPEK